MNQPSILFVTPSQDYGGCYQSVSYDTRDVCELSYWACLCRPCSLTFGDAMPLKAERDDRKPRSSSPLFLQQSLLLSCPSILIVLNPFFRVNVGCYRFPMIRKSNRHQYQPPLLSGPAFFNQKAHALQGVLYLALMYFNPASTCTCGFLGRTGYP